MFKVYIGFDPAEQLAGEVACRTLLETSGLHAEMLDLARLQNCGLYTRTIDTRGGRKYDLRSNAKQSTEFALTRFLVPILAQSGWALFTDCDVVFMDDVTKMLDEIEPDKAVYVVKHQYLPSTTDKMVGFEQTAYNRKNWSSVILWNVTHPANQRLTLQDINSRRGLDLHQFYWLNDAEIGELHPKWNWLVGEQPKPADTAIAHFTLGGPWLTGWQKSEHDELWLEAMNRAP